MRKIIPFIIAFVLLINLSSAVVQFYQDETIFPLNPHISRKTMSIVWIEGSYEGVKDVITGGTPLEVKLYYSLYPTRWNERNPTHKITNCSLSVFYNPHLANSSDLIYEETIFAGEPDVMAKSYFVMLNQKDFITSIVDCYFEDENKTTIITPTEFFAYFPTYECKSCQYYQWLTTNREVEKAQTIGGYTTEIWGFIGELVELNFEFILVVFWILLILTLCMGTGLIFIGMYYVYTYLRQLAREI